MAISDPVADMLTKIRNASQRSMRKLILRFQVEASDVKILKNDGFIKNFKKVTKDGISYIRVFLGSMMKSRILCSTESSASPPPVGESTPATGKCLGSTMAWA